MAAAAVAARAAPMPRARRRFVLLFMVLPSDLRPTLGARPAPRSTLISRPAPNQKVPESSQPFA
jgi:hypothetical protein